MSEPTIEVIDLRRADMNMRLVVNRAHGNVRIMDYRVGNYSEKRAELDELIRAEGLRKVYTLVEKQDSNNWKSVGFVKEGVYPGFFRTADAHAMGLSYDDRGRPMGAASSKPASDERTHFPGRQLRKPGGLKIEQVADEAQRTSLLTGLNGQLQALPFGRQDAPDIVLHAKAKGNQTWAMAEVDDSYGHATLGFAPAPASDRELVLCAYAGSSLLESLQKKGVTTLFGLSSSTDQWTNELYAGLGFKVTGRMAHHLRTPDGQVPALIWHARVKAA
jgi:hypothetical protein